MWAADLKPTLTFAHVIAGEVLSNPVPAVRPITNTPHSRMVAHYLFPGILHPSPHGADCKSGETHRTNFDRIVQPSARDALPRRSPLDP